MYEGKQPNAINSCKMTKTIRKHPGTIINDKTIKNNKNEMLLLKYLIDK